MEEQQPTTEELRAVQRDRKLGEQEAARQAPTEDAEQVHERRADKAAYLEEKLAEAQRSEEETD